MQSDPTARHSPIGSFQRTCYVVSAAAATARLLQATANPPWRHNSDATGHDVSSHPTPSDASCPMGRDRGTCVCSCRPTWVRWRSLPPSNPPPGAAGCLPDRVRVCQFSVPTVDRQVDRQTRRHKGSMVDEPGLLYTT
jgi:hypothetical protein